MEGKTADAEPAARSAAETKRRTWFLPNTQKDHLLGKAHMVEGIKNQTRERWWARVTVIRVWPLPYLSLPPSLRCPIPRKALHAALVARVHLSCPQVIIIGARIACVIGMSIGQATVIQRGLCRRAAERKLRL